MSLKRGTAAGRFVGLVQVSVSSLSTVIDSYILDSYSDDTHVVIKAHNFFRKLPLHNGSRQADLIDLKLIGISTSSQYGPRDVDAYEGYDDQGETVGTDFYRSQNPPTTVIHHEIGTASNGGDKQIFLFVPREFTDALKLESDASATIRFYISADFSDGVSVPVYMEVKRMPAVRVSFDDIDRIQIGNSAGGPLGLMSMSVDLDPDAGFDASCVPHTLYSFGKWTNNSLNQNLDVLSIYGNGSYFQPWALPVYRCATQPSSTAARQGTQTFRRVADGKNTSFLRWVTGTNRHFSGGQQGLASNNIQTGETADKNGIYLGRFFEMNRVDNVSNGESSQASLVARLSNSSGVSWGRRYGTINFFAKNISPEGVGINDAEYPQLANGTANESVTINGSRIGLSPTMGITYTSDSAAAALVNSPGTDLTATGSNCASFLYSPAVESQVELTNNLYQPTAITDLKDVNTAVGRRCFSTLQYLNDGTPCDLHGGADLPHKYICNIKDLKTSFFSQGMSTHGGQPMIVTARQLILDDEYTHADLDTNAWGMIHGPGNVNPNALYDQFTGPINPDNVRFSRANKSSIDHRGAYSITLNNTAGFPWGADIAGVNQDVFDASGTGNANNVIWPTGAPSLPFKAMPMSGLELVANWLMASTGSVGMPKVTPDKTKYYENEATKTYPAEVNQALTNLALHTPSTANEPLVTHASHNGKVMNFNSGGTLYPTLIGEGDVIEAGFGDAVPRRSQVGLSGYQDVIFIVALGTTTKNTFGMQTSGAVTDWNSNLPWSGTDVTMAALPGTAYENESGNTLGNYTACGGPTGTYYRASDNECANPNSGPQNARLISYRNNGNLFLYGSTTALFSPVQALSTTNTTICTDPVLKDGRDNLALSPTDSGLNYTSAGLGYLNSDLGFLSEGRPSQFAFTGIPSTAGSAQGQCKPYGDTGGAFQPLSLSIEITDNAGGFGVNAGGSTGFEGLTVKGALRYNLYGPDAESAFSTSTGLTTTNTVSGASQIWNLKLTPGNTSDNSDTFIYAQTVSPNDDADDIDEMKVESVGSTGKALRFKFRNNSNALIGAGATAEIPQVFPDLPFKRALPLRNDSGMLFGYSQTLGVSNSMDDILYDSFRSGFFNNEYGENTEQAAHSARTGRYYGEDFGETYNKNAIAPRRASILRIQPVDATYDELVYASNFITYGKVSTISGCTDPDAFNYNPNASLDDGSCVEAVSGCTNPAASNFNPNANSDDGSCTFCENYLSILSSHSGINAPALAINLNAAEQVAGSGGVLRFGRYNSATGATTTDQNMGLDPTNVASNNNPTTFEAVFGGLIPQTDAPWIESLARVGTFIDETTIPFAGVTSDIAISGVMESSLVSQFSPDAIDLLLDPTTHALNVYVATESAISYIFDNNNNAGELIPVGATAYPFIFETENGVAGYDATTGQTALQAGGFTPVITIPAAADIMETTSGPSAIAARFKLAGSEAQTPVTMFNSTLYVAEYYVRDASCGEVEKYAAMYGFFAIGVCGCTIFGNQNSPSLYPWQTANVSTWPVAYNLIPNCTNNYIEQSPAPAGDEGSLCFVPDEELSSCTSLYQQCILNPVNQCLDDVVIPDLETGLIDGSIIEQGGSYYYPIETTVTVRIDGIWNPTVNVYEINSALNYVIKVFINGIEEPALQQDITQGEVAEAGGNAQAIDHDFVFQGATSYYFVIEYQNPTGTIWSNIQGLGSTCAVSLPEITVDTVCPVNVGCTDPEAINTDENATFDDGSCNYADCEEIFLENVGGFTEVSTTTTNSSSICTDVTSTVLGQTVVTNYTEVNNDGSATVRVITDHEIEDFPAQQCYIVICPVNTTGVVGVSSASALLELILLSWANTEADGGTIEIGSGAQATISKLQELDVLYTTTTDAAQDYVNRDYDEPAGTDDGYTFSNLAPGTYFLFVIPPPELLTGISEFYTATCTTQTIDFLDQISTFNIGLDQPESGACEEDCGNPLGCQEEVYGCTDPDNENYNPDATLDDGSCAPDPACPPGSDDPDCIDCETEFAERTLGGNFKRRIDDAASDPCDPTEGGEGCTDPLACNYDPYIDTSNTNNQLCDYCSCNPDSIDCCQGEDCGCDPEIDDDCAPPPPPECPDPTNPDCDTIIVTPCYDQEECPPPPPPCTILGTCDPGGEDDGDDETDPVIPVINPVSVTCVPDFIEGDLFDQVQYAAMQCASDEGARMLVKLKSGIEFDEEDLIKLDLITYLFNGGADRQQLPCLWNCNYDTKTRFDKYTAEEKWANSGFKKWASTESYKKGTVVAYFYNRRGKTFVSYFSAMRDIGPKEIHPMYKSSPWKMVVDTKPKTVDPLKISNGQETYLKDFYEYFVRFCTSCETGQLPFANGADGQGDTGVTDESRNKIGIARKTQRPGNQTGIIGPDGEEIIF